MQDDAEFTVTYCKTDGMIGLVVQRAKGTLYFSFPPESARHIGKTLIKAADQAGDELIKSLLS